MERRQCRAESEGGPNPLGSIPLLCSSSPIPHAPPPPRRPNQILKSEQSVSAADPEHSAPWPRLPNRGIRLASLVRLSSLPVHFDSPPGISPPPGSQPRLDRRVSGLGFVGLLLSNLLAGFHLVFSLSCALVISTRVGSREHGVGGMADNASYSLEAALPCFFFKIFQNLSVKAIQFSVFFLKTLAKKLKK